MNIYQRFKERLMFLLFHSCHIYLLEHFQNIVIFQYNPQNHNIYVVPRCQRYFNITKHRLETSYNDLFDNILSGQGACYGRVQLNLNGSWVILEYQYIYKNKRLVRIDGYMTDIDDMKQYESYLLDVSQKDGLTHLYNKVTVEKRIEENILLHGKGTLLMLDIDCFKKLNDQYGHLEGDKILKGFAAELTSVFQNEIIGRIGGEEFIVYLKTMKKDNLIDKIDYLLTQVTSQYQIMPFSISIGIVNYNGQDTYEEFFHKADMAMYKAKSMCDQKYYFYE